MRRLAVREHPNVSGDACVVKHVERQGHDGFEPVVFDDPSADVALTLAGVTSEERRAVVNFGYAAAERRVVIHLRGHIGQKEHLPVVGTGYERIVGLAGVGYAEAWIAHSVLAANRI